MTCLIAEDEPIALKGMENFVRDAPFLQLVGTCDNAMEIMIELKEKPVDLLFLDIQMPRMTGMELLRSMTNIPATIITSAYADYALEGYSLNVVDYLVKPIPFERFLRAVNKAHDYFLLQQQTGSKHIDADFFFIKSNNRLE